MALGERPRDVHARQAAAGEATLKRLREGMPVRAFARLEMKVSVARQYGRFREDGKHYLMQSYAVLRAMVVDAGRRIGVSAEDVTLLDEEELLRVVGGGAAMPDVGSRGGRSGPWKKAQLVAAGSDWG